LWPSNPTTSTFTANISFADPTQAHNFTWSIFGPSTGGGGGGIIVQAENFPIGVADVVAQLNASGPDSNNNYTVYGLTISQATIQAHVNYANNYITAMISTPLTSADVRFASASIACLDLACLRVLVVSSGGSLNGAYDYFLGDLRITRAAPYAGALQRTIEGLKADVIKMITNLSTPVVIGNVKYGDQTPTYRGGLASP
jgi:hypothetical protein